MIKNNNEIIIEIQIEDIRLVCMLDRNFERNENNLIIKSNGEFHTHPYHEIFIGLGGEYIIDFINIKPFKMEKNCVCLVPPGIHHVTRECDHQPDSLKLALRFFFTQEDISDNNNFSFYNQFNEFWKKHPDPFMLKNCETLCNLITEMRTELNSYEMYFNIYAELLLKAFFIKFIRMILKESTNDLVYQNTIAADEVNSRYLRIENFMHKNYSFPITESDLATEMNLSDRQVERILNSIYGKNFREILIDIRIHNAAYLLVTTNMTVEKIALSVGYESLSGFYSTFKQRFGIPAAMYRRKLKQKSVQ